MYPCKTRLVRKAQVDRVPRFSSTLLVYRGSGRKAARMSQVCSGTSLGDWLLQKQAGSILNN
jgi:hypothetical protein